MIEVKAYCNDDKKQVIDLVLHCQNDGTRPLVNEYDQPDILNIMEEYFNVGGYFWVAKENDKVLGSIGLMNYGNGVAILKKFFVYEAYRGAPHHLGKKLYDKFLEYANEIGIKTIILDTPKNTERAHRFYEKAGFEKINKELLPVKYNYPYEDSDFFILKIK